MDNPKADQKRQQEREAGGAPAAVVDKATTYGSGERHSDSEDLNNLGVAHHTRCEIELAIGKYREALSANAGFADARNNLGAAYYHCGDVDRAIREWEEAIRLNAALVQAHHNLGIGYEAQGRFDLAVQAWESALRADPRDADVYLGLGEICETWGDPQAAAKNYERFLDLARSRSDFWAGVARERIRLLRQEARGETRHHLEGSPPGQPRLPLVLA